LHRFSRLRVRKNSGIVIQAGTAQPIDGVQNHSDTCDKSAWNGAESKGSFTDQLDDSEVGDLAPGRYRVQ